MNNSTIPIHSSDGIVMDSNGFWRLYSSTSASKRLWSKNGSIHRIFYISTARTLHGILPVFLMLSKMFPSHAVTGTRQSCVPRKLPTHWSWSYLKYLFYLGYIFNLPVPILASSTAQQFFKPHLQLLCCQSVNGTRPIKAPVTRMAIFQPVIFYLENYWVSWINNGLKRKRTP